MVDTNGKDIWLRDLDAREVFPLSMEFLGLAGYQSNIRCYSLSDFQKDFMDFEKCLDFEKNRFSIFFNLKLF